jgi:cytochrome c biogenesis protein CcmG, thiol:disulfide interchange protein DsbE
MKHIITAVLLLSSIPCFAGNLAGNDAPAFSVMAQDKGQISLSQFKGKVVYLDFWASWCGPCRKSFPWMNAMQSKYGAQGLQVVGINLDEKSEDGLHFLKETPAQFTVGFDSKGITPGLYGVKGMPSSLLIGRDGKVILEHSGFNDADRAELEKKILAAMEAGK